MLVVIIVLLLVSSFIGGVFLFMKNKGGTTEKVTTGEIQKISNKTVSSSEQEIVRSSIKTYPRAQFIKIGKTGIVSNWKNRNINLMEVYVYDKNDNNIALKKPIASNTPGFKGTVSKLVDGDEMTMGQTGSLEENESQQQRQSFEIDLGSMYEIKSVVLLDKTNGDPDRLDRIRVTLIDDDLKIVSKTRDLTMSDVKKGSKHKYDFGTGKWSLQSVDCIGKWSEWSPCSVGCGTKGESQEGQTKRKWITIRKAENGGKACVYDLNKDGFKKCMSRCTAMGRYVKILHTRTHKTHGHNGIINLSDVRVYDIDGNNISAHRGVSGTSEHSSTHNWQNLTDGSTHNFAHTGHGDQKGNNYSARFRKKGWTIDQPEYFIIDLGMRAEIKRLQVVNRRDCCRGRIHGIKLQIIDEDGKTVNWETPIITGSPWDSILTLPEQKWKH